MSRQKLLTDEQVIEMRKIYQGWIDRREKTSYAVLCRMFDCGESTVRDIIRYKTRTNIVGDNTQIKDGFVIAQMARQDILDYLNKTPGMFQSNLAIETAIGLTHDHTYRTTRRMVELQELEQSGTGLKAKFRPLVETTVLGSVLQEAAKTKRLKDLENEEKSKKKVRPDEPWRTVHIGGRDQAIKNQGGQGFYYMNSWRRPNGSGT